MTWDEFKKENMLHGACHRCLHSEMWSDGLHCQHEDISLDERIYSLVAPMTACIKFRKDRRVADRPRRKTDRTRG